MISYFTIHTETPWDNLKTEQLTQVKLMSLKSIFKSFPLIEEAFFKDLISKVYNNKHYSWIQCIKRIIGPNNEDYSIANWNFIWAFDEQRRMFQFLFQKVKEKEDSQGILVGLAPPELGKFFAEHKKDAIYRIFSLLNNPSKIKFLMVLAPRGKSLAEEQQVFRVNKNYLDKLKYINILNNMPNIQGHWFPSFKPRCPICNQELMGLQDYNIGFGQLTCPRCGYKKN